LAAVARGRSSCFAEVVAGTVIAAAVVAGTEIAAAAVAAAVMR
jgi:hypothetical protein